MKQVIGFAGRKRSGKGALCEHLRDTRSATIVTVANALKQLCCELICVDSIDELNELKDNPNSYINLFVSNKNIWTLILAKELGFDLDEDLSELYDMVSGYIDKKTSTVRELLQFVGTDIIRHFNPNWHVEKLTESIKNAPTDLVVVDDVRFPNERKALEDLGGIVFFVIRPDLSIEVSNHQSETSLHWYDFDDNRVIVNMCSIEDLHNGFDEYLDHEFMFSSDMPILKAGLHCFNDVNPKFGINLEDCDENKLVRIIITDDTFRKTGIIQILTHNQTESKIVTDLLYKNGKRCENGYMQFLVWNPYIIENLKMLL